MSIRLEWVCQSVNNMRALPQDASLATNAKWSWHRPTDQEARQFVLDHLVSIVQEDAGSTLESELICRYAQSVEAEMYTRAGSYEEYLNVDTLSVRYYHAATVLLHAAQVEKKHLNLKRRRRPKGYLITSKRCCKRLRRTSTFKATCFLPGHDELMQHIYSFLTTRDTVIHTSVNRYCAKLLPHCVDTLYLNVHQRQSLSLCALLQRFVRVETLLVGDVPSHLDRYRASEDFLSPKLLPDWDPFGEHLFASISQAMRSGKAKQLKNIMFKTPLYHIRSKVAFAQILTQLSTGSCPNLQRLDLGCCAISDPLCTFVSRFLVSEYSRNLIELDLRHSFIGEMGMRDLSLAISSCTALELLLLGGNILSDRTINDFATVLTTGSLSHLSVLTLDRNFLRQEGVTRLVTALQQNQCPALEYLDFGSNKTQDGGLDIARLVELNACPKLSLIDAGNVSELAAQAIEHALAQRRESYNQGAQVGPI